MIGPRSAPERGRPGRGRILAGLLLAAPALAPGALLLAGCATASPPAMVPAPTLREMVRSELYFGLTRPGGGTVTETAWQAFLAEHVTPRFPAGLTVLEATGQWKEAGGRIVREPSRVLVLFHEPGPGPTGAIDEIRTLYRQLFEQEAVLLTRSTVRVGF